MKEIILPAYDLALGSKNIDIKRPGGPKYSIQFAWSGLTGTKNGTVKIKQSLDGTNFDQLKTMDASGAEVDFGISITTTAGSATLEDKDGFTGEYMRVALAVGSITGGTISITLNTI